METLLFREITSWKFHIDLAGFHFFLHKKLNLFVGVSAPSEVCLWGREG